MVIAEIQFRSTNVSWPCGSCWGLNQLAAILLVVFSHWLSFKKKMTFDSNFSERMTSHWLNQSRSTYLTPRGVTSPRGVKKWRKISAICHYVWSYSEQKITSETSKQIMSNIIQSSAFITRSNKHILYTTAATETELNHRLNAQKTAHSSPSWANYGVSFVRIWVKIDRLITAPHCSQHHASWCPTSVRGCDICRCTGD